MSIMQISQWLDLTEDLPPIPREMRVDQLALDWFCRTYGVEEEGSRWPLPARCGIPIIVDSTLPPGTAKLVGANGEVINIININLGEPE